MKCQSALYGLQVGPHRGPASLSAGMGVWSEAMGPLQAAVVMAGQHLVLGMDSPPFLNNLFCDKTPHCLPQNMKFHDCFKLI